MTALEIELKVQDICGPVFKLILSENDSPDITCQVVAGYINRIANAIIIKYRQNGSLEKN